MATQKPISTISYNTEPFLHEVLERWKKNHIIQAYQYICHKGEDGDKDHIHVRVEPNKRIDPMELTDELKEYTKDNLKPLGVRPWRPSQEEDWILYAVHDEKYLSEKYSQGGAEKEKIPYEWQDIVVPEDYDMETAYIRAKAKQKHTTANAAERIEHGEDPVKLVQQGYSVTAIGGLYRLYADTKYTEVALKLESEKRKNQLILQALKDNLGIEVIIDEEDNVFFTSIEERNKENEDKNTSDQ